MNRALFVVVVAVCLVALTGCEEDDERLVRFAEESTRQQAGQNREMSQLNREVAHAHRELVSLQHDLEEQQAEVNRQRDQLESERREIAQQRHRDPIIAAAISNVGLVLACLIPLALAGYLLYCLCNQKDDPVVTELLIEEIASEQPKLLPPPRTGIARIEGQRKQNRTFIVVLSPVVQIPTELEKVFVVLEHDLPSRQQLEEIAHGIATEDGELPEGEELQTVLDAAAGLTRYEAEGAFSLSVVRHQAIRPDSVWELKAGMLKKSGLLQLYRGGERFDALGGLQALKTFCLRSMRNQGHRDPLRRPRGVLLLSPPGCGKSQFAKCLGNETGRPTLIFDVGALCRSLVGQTEGNVRRAIQLIEAMAPCVCLIDEVEKALSGAASSGQTDSGVSARLFGTLLSWMNDRTSDVFLLATCADIAKLPPEFGRAERFDGVWFLDLPGQEQRQAIWEIYLKMFELDLDQPRPRDEGWSGAEIRAGCRLSALLDVPLRAAAQNVVPVSATAVESVERLRTWASGRCLDADRGGIYSGSPSRGGVKPRRRVNRDPLNN